jgi:hypothetical protein
MSDIWWVWGGICQEYFVFRVFSVKQSNKQWNKLDTPDYAWNRHILGILHDFNENHALFTDQGIYDRYMTGIYMSYVSIILGSGTLAGLQGLPTALCRVTPAPLVKHCCFSNGETDNSRLVPSKAPQPSVDIIYMASRPLCVSSPLAGPSARQIGIPDPVEHHTYVEWPAKEYGLDLLNLNSSHGHYQVLC